MSIEQIWRYPVKSMQGECLGSTKITDIVPGDRGWGIIDNETGHLLSAKRFPKLLEGHAKIIRDDCIIKIDRSEYSSEEKDIHVKLSTWLGQSVTLMKPNLDEVKNIEIEWDDGTEETLEDPDIFEFPTSPGWFFDSSSSLSLMGSATLDLLEKRVGPGSGDVRRFRPNLVVTTKKPFEENDWVGKNLRIGTCEIYVKKKTDRCVVITRQFGEFPASRSALRYLSEHHDREAGISMNPTKRGEIHTGDIVEVIDN
jgi:uncharacterized protein YcbX